MNKAKFFLILFLFLSINIAFADTASSRILSIIPADSRNFYVLNSSSKGYVEQLQHYKGIGVVEENARSIFEKHVGIEFSTNENRILELLIRHGLSDTEFADEIGLVFSKDKAFTVIVYANNKVVIPQIVTLIQQLTEEVKTEIVSEGKLKLTILKTKVQLYLEHKDNLLLVSSNSNEIQNYFRAWQEQPASNSKFSTKHQIAQEAVFFHANLESIPNSSEYEKLNYLTTFLNAKQLYAEIAFQNDFQKVLLSGTTSAPSSQSAKITTGRFFDSFSADSPFAFSSALKYFQNELIYFATLFFMPGTGGFYPIDSSLNSLAIGTTPFDGKNLPDLIIAMGTEEPDALRSEFKAELTSKKRLPGKITVRSQDINGLQVDAYMLNELLPLAYISTIGKDVILAFSMSGIEYITKQSEKKLSEQVDTLHRVKLSTEDSLIKGYLNMSHISLLYESWLLFVQRHNSKITPEEWRIADYLSLYDSIAFHNREISDGYFSGQISLKMKSPGA
jgi:hypothetical protein